VRFCFVLPDLSGGGAERAILNIAGNLLQREHQVDIILFRGKIEYKPPEGINISILSNNPSFNWIGKRVLAYKLSNTIKQLEKTIKFNIIISTLPLADEVSVIAKLHNHWCRIANTLSIEIDRLAKNNISKSKRRLNRYQNIYNGRGLIAVSSGVKIDLIDNIELDKAEIKVIYNPFNFGRICDLSKEDIDVPTDSYIIHVGRFSAQKRHDVLLDAYKNTHNPYKLVLLTNSDSQLIEMISRRCLSDRVIIAGFQKNPYSWIKNAQLLVLSSDHEGMPNVIIESLIVGTPVVSTDCPSGPREILGREFPQYLVPVNNSVALSKAIDFAIDNKVDMRSIDLTKYQLEDSIDGYESLIRSNK